MHIFLVWYSKNKRLKGDKIADGMINHYQPQVKQKINKYTYTNEWVGSIHISEKSLTENNYFLQRDDTTVCFLTGTPTGFDRLFSENNIETNETNYLLRLKKLFDRNGFDLIKQISPPFIFGFIENDYLNIVHDGLGFEQGFIYEDDDFWVCSNRCWPITKLIGKKVNVDDAAWKQYFEVGNFPLNRTPFKEISVLRRGEVWRCSNGQVSNEMIDCFSDWLNPLEGTKEDILIFARDSFNESVKELIERYCDNQALADLSGGRDTRAILSSILNQNINCVFQTVGDENSADIKIAEMLENQHSLKVWYTNPKPENVDQDQLKAKINKFTVWQDGFGETKSCKYMSNNPSGEPLRPILSGLMGTEIHRAHYHHDALDKSVRKIVRSVLKGIIGRKSEILQSRNTIGNVKKLVFQEGKKYRLTGYTFLDYYNLVEKARRWGSAVAATPFDGYCLPFLNIGLIKATFSLTENDRKSQAIHKYITATNVEDLDKIPYDTDLVSKDKTLTKTPYDENVFWRNHAGRSLMEMILSQDHYMWNRLLNKAIIDNIWKGHCELKTNHGDFFWRIAGFYFWYAHFRPFLNPDMLEPSRLK